MVTFWEKTSHFRYLRTLLRQCCLTNMTRFLWSIGDVVNEVTLAKFFVHKKSRKFSVFHQNAKGRFNEK